MIKTKTITQGEKELLTENGIPTRNPETIRKIFAKIGAKRVVSGNVNAFVITEEQLETWNNQFKA